MVKKYNDGSLYSYSAGFYCGVFMKESVMKKLAKLQAKHSDDVKRLLTDEADNGNVFPYGWTLHYPDGIQTTVHYIDQTGTAKKSIDAAVRTDVPKHHPLVFIAGSMGEAEIMADEYYQEAGA